MGWTLADVTGRLQDLIVHGGAVSLVQAPDGQGHIHLHVVAPELKGRADMLLRLLNRRLPEGQNVRHLTPRAKDALAASMPVYDLVLKRRGASVPSITPWSSLIASAPAEEAIEAEPVLPVVFKNDAELNARIITLKDIGDEHYVRAVILEPNTVDLTSKNPDGSPTGAVGDLYLGEDIRFAMHYWMENSGVITLMHEAHGGTTLGPADIVLLENFQMPMDGELDGVSVKKDSWIQAHRVRNPQLWVDFKSGKIKSWSIGASMRWHLEEVNVEEVDQAQRIS